MFVVAPCPVNVSFCYLVLLCVLAQIRKLIAAIKEHGSHENDKTTITFGHLWETSSHDFEVGLGKWWWRGLGNTRRC